MPWWQERPHAPVLISGGLVDMSDGLYRSWELSTDRYGAPSMHCGSGAAGSNTR